MDEFLIANSGLSQSGWESRIRADTRVGIDLEDVYTTRRIHPHVHAGVVSEQESPKTIYGRSLHFSFESPGEICGEDPRGVLIFK